MSIHPIHKIAIIDPVGVKAGMDYYSQNLLKGLAEQGVDTHLLSNVENGTRSGVRARKVFSKNSVGKVRKVSNILLGHFKAAYLCRKENIDVAVLHVFATNFGCFAGFAITKLFGLKVLAITHDVQSFASDDFSLVRRLIYQNLTNWNSVHNKLSELQLIEILPDKFNQNTLYIAEQGSYTEQLDDSVTRSNAREQLGLEQDTKYGLFFGQIKKTKGLDTLIGAWGKSSLPCKLIIAGKPWRQSFDEYQRLIDENNLDASIVKYIRYIEDNERELFFKACDFVVLPYTEIYQSAVLLMAMSYGLPVITSDIEGFSVIVNDADCGLVFEPGNEQALNNAIQELVGSNALLMNLSKNAQVAVDTKYDWSSIAKVHLDNLRRLI